MFEAMSQGENLEGNPERLEQVAMDIQLIDDLLSIHRMRVFSRPLMYTNAGRIRKDVTLQGMFNARLDNYLKEWKDFTNENTGKQLKSKTKE